MKLAVESFTQPIDPNEIIARVDKSFASGGSGSGGGGGGSEVVVNNPNINSSGGQMEAPIAVGVNTEVDLVSYDLAFDGGLQGMMMAFAAFQGGVINATLRLYINGVKLTETRVSAGQSLSWGSSIIPQTAGVKTCKITALNQGSVPLSVTSASAMTMEFRV